MDIQKVLERLNSEIPNNLSASLNTEGGITVTNIPANKEVYGCDAKGRCWNEHGYEDEVQHLDSLTNYA